MTTTTLSELTGRDHENRGRDFGKIWDACASPVYAVLDEEGNNVANGRVRHLLGRHWLYVDDTDGYAIQDEGSVGYLILSPEA